MLLVNLNIKTATMKVYNLSTLDKLNDLNKGSDSVCIAGDYQYLRTRFCTVSGPPATRLTVSVGQFVSVMLVSRISHYPTDE